MVRDEPDSWSRRWSRANALALFAALSLTMVLRSPAVLTAAAGASFALLLVSARREYGPTGFGLANVVTTLRLLLTLLMLALAEGSSGEWIALAALVILLLDAVDGWAARRAGEATEFGARYDVEADSLLVLALTVMLWLRAAAGPWVLLAGLWRYVYILAPRLFPTSRPEAERSRLGRYIYVFMIATFLLAFVLPVPLGGTAAALGTFAVSVSFLRSFWERYVVRETTRGTSR